MVKNPPNWNRTRKPGQLANAVRQHHRLGRSDTEIADLLNVTAPTVFACRKRLNLPANIAPQESGELGGVTSGLSRRLKFTAGNGHSGLPARILAVLGESPIPVSTPELILLCAAGLSSPRHRVWATVRSLERGGLVLKSHRRTPESGRGGNQRVACWSLA